MVSLWVSGWIYTAESRSDQPFKMSDRTPDERLRLEQITQLRRRWLKDQELSPREPVLKPQAPGAVARFWAGFLEPKSLWRLYVSLQSWYKQPRFRAHTHQHVQYSSCHVQHFFSILSLQYYHAALPFIIMCNILLIMCNASSLHYYYYPFIAFQLLPNCFCRLNIYTSPIFVYFS